MSDASRMLETTPVEFGFDAAALAACIDACFSCAQTCTACADACLGEDMAAELRRCIRLDLDCADVCAAAGRVLSRQVAYDPDVTWAVLTACAEACRVCGDECERHASMHEHCRICAAACRRCEAACRALLESMQS